MKIAIAGTGYVGLSNGLLLAQHNEVVALDIIPEKVGMLKNKKSPIEDTEIEEYLLKDDLNFTATLDKEQALLDQNFVMDDSLSVSQALEKEAKAQGGTAKIVEFIKYEVGDGLEKKVDDFAAEVAAQMG